LWEPGEEEAEDEVMSEENIAHIQERRLNMIRIINEVAGNIDYNISPQEELQMQSWDMVQLRKKLGAINVYKKGNKNKRSVVPEVNQKEVRSTFQVNKNEPVYDEAGLNVAAVSNVITPVKKNEIDACKPPEVEKVIKETPIKHPLRHTYTARLRLHITDPSVNVGLMLKKMYQLWKETDSSALLLAHAGK